MHGPSDVLQDLKDVTAIEIEKSLNARLPLKFVLDFQSMLKIQFTQK